MTGPAKLAQHTFAAAALLWAQDQPAVVAENFQAYLLNSQTGKLSADILEGDRSTLTNAVIGQYHSSSTFLTLRLRVNHRAAFRNARVRLVAVEGPAPFGANAPPRMILDRISSLNPPGGDGLTHLGFWLPATGCKPIDLRVTITGIGTPAAAALTDRIPFVCYE